MKYLTFVLLVGSYTLIGEGCHFPGVRGDKGGVSFEAPWGTSDEAPEPENAKDANDTTPPADKD